ncbi:MFS polyamine transporter [Artomyces pyxidatus]|uniref:MFS polyamine transporter n=1 Tax=Artomyces pyxidatus TaxID=48021 RepID=A0ACB8TGZ7_9AGAM|nr:MFS polyamine transporter [Artomyces pyxidatus]
MAQKWTVTIIVSAFTFISPVSSSMIAPATEQVAEQFGITSTVIIAMTTSVFVLAYAFGPLLLGPLSEVLGRSLVLQLSNMWYFAWNLSCGFAQSKGQLIAFRFLAGLGGSAPLAVGGGVISDLFKPEQRGQAVAIFSLAPLLGPVVGPIAGAWIADKSTWRWVFWSTSIVDGVVQLFGLIYLKETYAPILLDRKAVRTIKEMNEERTHRVEVRTTFQSTDRSWQSILGKALVRPFTLFASEPIVQLLGVYMAFVYGLMYLYITTLPGIFQNVYHQKIGMAGLNYLALGIGITAASQINARYMDRMYAYLKTRNGGVGKPEFRMPSIVPGTIFLPAGLLMTGWSAQNHVHWIVTDIGIALVGGGTILNFQSISTYVIDSFALHAASALAAVTFLRSMAGFGFPLFAPAMYNALGYGKGDTILAAVSIAIGCPAWVLTSLLRPMHP